MGLDFTSPWWKELVEIPLRITIFGERRKTSPFSHPIIIAPFRVQKGSREPQSPLIVPLRNWFGERKIKCSSISPFKIFDHLKASLIKIKNSRKLVGIFCNIVFIWLTLSLLFLSSKSNWKGSWFMKFNGLILFFIIQQVYHSFSN